MTWSVLGFILNWMKTGIDTFSALLPDLTEDKLMCAYESEILRYQLHLYARRRYPDLVFEPERLQYVLDEWGIISMRQLFDLPAEAKIAITLPLLIPRPQNRITLIDCKSRVAA